MCTIVKPNALCKIMATDCCILGFLDIYILGYVHFTIVVWFWFAWFVWSRLQTKKKVLVLVSFMFILVFTLNLKA